MRKVTGVAVCLLLCALGAHRAGGQVVPFFSADLTGGDAIPPNGSSAGGHLSTESTVRAPCAAGDSLRIYLYYWDLEGLPTGARLYRAEWGERGKVVRILWSRSFETPSRTGVLLDDETCADLASGRIYVAITTTRYPEGEIRGQVRLDQSDAERTVQTWGKIKALY